MTERDVLYQRLIYFLINKLSSKLKYDINFNYEDYENEIITEEIKNNSE